MQKLKVNKDSSLAHKNSYPQSKLMVVNREFNVSVDKLFEAFTSSETLKVWWWPQNIYADKIELDFRIGGKYFINMKGFDDGGGGGMTGLFEAIVKNELIIMTDYFADKNGQAISAQEANMPGEWPEVVYITIEFDAVDEHTSRLSLSQEGIPNELQKECVQGWSQSFDKLDEYLS